MNEKVQSFGDLHIPGNPLILVNIWDAGSAKAVAAAGAKALATGSYGVAGAQGIADGEAFPLDDAMINLEHIAAVTDLPISIDLEAGYGDDSGRVRQSAQRAYDAGASGINMEDRMPGEDPLLAPEVFAERLAAAASSGLWVNARCDVFRGQSAEENGEALVAQVLERANIYADAGAGSLFVPFLSDAVCIGTICEASPLPVNILRAPDGPDHKALAGLGVARISHGHQSWAAAMDWLTGQAQRVFEGGEPDY
ncbi:MAG: isocitrate lyase/phosphoenolpyruvate mutase family protein [Parasphingorhabdus sp.]|uniref:isocitrate lyase/PEP mutase family protein n=1 Tax=Parasphingorhabdus sp. TaxID=2709688 RepID=UPI003264A33D